MTLLINVLSGCSVDQKRMHTLESNDQTNYEASARELRLFVVVLFMKFAKLCKPTIQYFRPSYLPNNLYQIEAY